MSKRMNGLFIVLPFLKKIGILLGFLLIYRLVALTNMYFNEMAVEQLLRDMEIIPNQCELLKEKE